MPLYMSQFSYTPEALKAFVKNPEDRTSVIQELTERSWEAALLLSTTLLVSMMGSSFGSSQMR